MAGLTTTITAAAAAKPHFILIPLMAQGHMIPMVDMACLLADGGALVTFITTPVNAARIRPSINRIQASSLPICFVELRFPSAEAGLPPGCENLDLLPDSKLNKPFVESLPLLRSQLELLVGDQIPIPDGIISDSKHAWASSMARKLCVPHIIFHGPSCFYLHSTLSIKRHKILDRIKDEFEPFVLPDLPQRIEMVRAQVERWVDSPTWEKLRDECYAAEEAADGIVINTFEELEPWCIEMYRKATGKKVWPIGPLSLYNREMESRARRGNEVPVLEAEKLQRWLDERDEGSVVFISFGSLARNPIAQLTEIGCGLEAAGVRFIWVVKEAEVESGTEAGKWMEEFSERSEREKKGIVVKGWAPQMVVLSHPAVGGFMTHCGWNSILEAICAGVPMATWPHFADQFLNERLVVEVLGIGVPVGAMVPVKPADAERKEAVVGREKVGRAVEKLMDGGEEGEGRRRRAREFGERGRRAMEEGGSSYENLKGVIEYACGHKNRRNGHLKI
ncbi:UDP-glycosyltransferase 73C5-like [Phalaenopsis equestris]|uniref:UDP-glycosyltransferase 73C5-like n=1 Tax=Phalaenopsis equestris TaxID=78828 RepID=UPI0009E3BA06|nr:UDP-glycosyltransferase 73C5-like [Phalaenopsis equestris]